MKDKKKPLILLTVFILVCLAAATLIQDSLAKPLGTTITVTTQADEYAVYNGKCSLREAIVASNTDAAFGGCPGGSGRDTIYLPTGSYTLTIPGLSDDDSVSGDLDIRDDVFIYGAGVKSTSINGNNLDRIFQIVDVGGFPPTNIEVEIWDLTIENGYVPSTGVGGGGVNLEGETNSLDIHDCVIKDNQTPDAVGGGIVNQGGTLVVTNCTISENLAARGGGIYTKGETTIYQSLIVENFGDVDGGGIDSSDPGTLTLINVTLTANTSDSGSAIFTTSNVNITNSSIVVNSGAGDGVGNNGDINVKNTIIAFNGELGAENCGGTTGNIISNGYNMENVDTCGFSSTGDQPNTDPLLEVKGLKDNGGPTKTIKLEYGSPAIDTADNTDCPPGDQRGFPRPVDGDQNETEICDIGAYEANEILYTYFPLILK
jgi:CSLREA domain-containing protein